MRTEQELRDIATWGICPCGQPMRCDLIDNPEDPGGKIALRRCYNWQNHELTLDALLRYNP